MAAITISDLNLAGSDLFMDSESFMMDLHEDELGVTGGISWTIAVASSKACIVGGAVVVGAVIGWFAN